VHVHEKLVLQLIAGSITAWWVYAKLGPAWHNIYLPSNHIIFAGWLIIPVIIFIVMFTANAVNIADGMDGLAGGMLISTFSALTLLSWINGFGEIAVLNATTVGALVAYTYFNIKPARFMMGDVGSLGLGALFAVNTLAIGEIGSIFFLGFLFYIEAISVVIQVLSRYILGRRLFKMAPLHHHFRARRLERRKNYHALLDCPFHFRRLWRLVRTSLIMEYLHWKKEGVSDFSDAQITKIYGWFCVYG
jgi:phospho-N-acetylmuramoyl-pentapeptide-transferase